MELKQIIGSVIKDIRQSQNITQLHLAKASKLHYEYISKIERGLRQPSISTFYRIAKALNTTMGDIVGEIDRRRKR